MGKQRAKTKKKSTGAKMSRTGKRVSGRKRKPEKKKSAAKIILYILLFCFAVTALGMGGYLFCQSYKTISTEAIVQEGVKLLEAEKYEEAIAQFQAAITNEESLKEKGKEATVTVENTPYVTEAYRGLGMAYYAQQDYEKTREYLQQALDLGAEPTPVLYNLMGIAAMYLTDYDGALSAFEAGTVLPAAGVYTDAELVEQTVDYSAVIQEMKFNRIVCFEKKLDWASAKAEMEAYMTAYPEDASVQKEADFLSTR